MWIEKPWQAGVLTPHQKQILTRNTSPQLLEPSADLCDQKQISYVNMVCPKSKCSKHLQKKTTKYQKTIQKSRFFQDDWWLTKHHEPDETCGNSLVVSQTKVTSNPETPWSKRHKHNMVYTFIWILWNTYEYLWHLMSPCPWQFLSDPIWEVRDPNKSRNQKKEKHHACKVL